MASSRPSRRETPDLGVPALFTGSFVAASTSIGNRLGDFGIPAPSVALRATSAPAGPVRLSSGVTSGLLLAPIQPAYPQIAKATHTEGTVVITATIDRDGRVTGARVLSGPELLRGSALEAVAGARYRPYRLNGQPTAVLTTISINFRLGS